MKKKVKIAFQSIFLFLKKNMDIVSRLIFLFLIVCEIVICIYQYRTRPIYGNHTEIDAIGEYDTVLAVRYTNDAWVHEDYGFVVNKVGRVKTFDFSDREVVFEDLLSEFDKVLRDSSIPLCENEIFLSTDILSMVVNVEDYKLKRPFPAGSMSIDAETYTYYSVCGSGINRKELKMRIERGADIEWKCNDRKINNLCEELRDCSNEIFETIWATPTETAQ